MLRGGCFVCVLSDALADVATYEVAEVRLHGASHKSPFAVDCVAEISGPEVSARGTIETHLFYDGDQEWVFRFSPDVPGTWQWKTSCDVPQFKGCFKEKSSDRDLPIKKGSGTVAQCRAECAGHAFFGQHWTRECWCGDSFGKHGEASDCLCSSEQMETKGATRNCVYSSQGLSDAGLSEQAGTVLVTNGSTRGGLRQHSDNRHQFMYEDGSPYTLVALEADWLWALALQGGDGEGFLDHLAWFGFNHFLVQVYSNHSGWNADLPAWQPPRYSPSVPSPWANDAKTELDLAYWRNLDKLLESMSKRGLVANLMIYVGNKNVQWPTRGSLADAIYWRHTLARFAAFSSVVWDVSKESGSYDVGSAYASDRMKLVVERNSHQRLVTSHSGLRQTNKCPTSSSGKDLCTMQSLQVHFRDLGGVLEQEPHYYPDMVERLSAASVPVSNLEFFYEAGPLRSCKGSCCNGCAQSQEELRAMRRVLWDLYMAGGSGAWYHSDVSWDVIVPSTNSTGFMYVKHLSSFWNALDVPSLSRSDIVQANGTVHALASDSDIVIHSRGAGFTVNIAQESIRSASWFEPESGSHHAAPAPQSLSQSKPHFEPPSAFVDDAVLHIRLQQATFV